MAKSKPAPPDDEEAGGDGGGEASGCACGREAPEHKAALNEHHAKIHKHLTAAFNANKAGDKGAVQNHIQQAGMAAKNLHETASAPVPSDESEAPAPEAEGPNG
jgi:hypothetical protein